MGTAGPRYYQPRGAEVTQVDVCSRYTRVFRLTPGCLREWIGGGADGAEMEAAESACRCGRGEQSAEHR